MNAKKFTFLLFVYLLFYFSCSSKKERIESLIMDCIYETYDDGGLAMKQAINDYERLLIEEEFIKDNSGESYKNTFLKLQESNSFTNLPSITFQGFISNMPQPNEVKISECQGLLIDSLKYDSSKIKAIDKVLQKHITSSDLNLKALAVDITSTLNEEDFKLDYYKIRFFMMFNLIEKDRQLLRSLPKQDNQSIEEKDLSNALNISINAKNELHANGAVSNLIDIKKLVNTYVAKHQSESIIVLKYDKGCSYEEYINTQNTIVSAINDLREGLAKELFDTSLESLTKNQRIEVRKVYPLNLIEEAF